MVWLLLGCVGSGPETAWQEPARMLQAHARTVAEAEPDGLWLAVQSGHGARPLRVAASPDGNFVATADDTGLVVIWDAWRGRQVRVLSGPSTPVLSLVWWAQMPDAVPLVVTRDARGQLSAWSAETGLPADVSLPRALSMAASPDGTRLAVGTHSGEVLLFAGAARRSLSAPSGPVRVAFADRDTVIATDRDSMHVWAVVSDAHRQWPLAEAPTALAARDGWVVTGAPAQGVCGWSLDAPTARWCVPSDAPLEGLAVLAGGRVVARFEGGGAWERWLRTGDQPPDSVLPAGMAYPVADVAPSGRAAVVTDTHGQIWNTAPVGPASFGGRAHSGRRAVLGGARVLVSGDGHHSVWDRAAGQLELHLETEPAPATLSQDGQWLVVGAPGRLLRHDLGRYCLEEQALAVTPTDIAASSDGARTLIGSSAGVMLLEAGSDVPLWASAAAESPRLGISPDGGHAIAASEDGRVVVWDGETPRTLRIPRATIGGVAFLGEAWLLFGASGRAGGAWEIALDGSSVVEWAELPAPVLSAAPLGDGDVLAALSDGQRCTRSGCERPPSALSVPLQGLSASADGATLAGGRLDGGALLWAAGAPDEALHLVTFDDDRAYQGLPRCGEQEPGDVASLLAQQQVPWAVLQPLQQRYDTDALTRDAALHWAVGGTMVTAPLSALADDRYTPELLRGAGAARGAPISPQVDLPPRVWLPEWPRFSAGDDSVEVCADAAVSLRVQLNGRDLAGGLVLEEGALCARVALDPAQVGLRRDENTLAISTGAPTLEGLPLVYRMDGDSAVPLEEAPELSVLPGGGGLPRKQLSKTATAPPHAGLYLLAVGISGYTEPGLRLSYADGDAEALAQLLQRGAAGTEPLFGTVEIKVLVDREGEDGGVQPDQILAAARELIGQMTSPDDIFGLFFAGHGVVREADGDWYFLTSDAPAAALQGALSPADAAAHGVSTAQLMALLQEARALRQVLVLDTCASGVAADALAAQRGALTRLTDQAGLLVLAASDEAAYESSGEEHGLLTHGLLRALTNEHLVRNYDNYWFVGPLFDFAAWEVARKTGGAQHPIVLRPSRERFHVGRWHSGLLPEDGAMGPTVLMDAESLGDPLGLSAGFDAALQARERLVGHGAAPHLVGHYTERGGQIRISAGIVEGGEVLHQTTLQATGAADAVEALSSWAAQRLGADHGR